MTEHVYEYPLDDFEPSKACLQFSISGGQCCPEGTHRHDCEIVQGYQKQRLSHTPVPMTRNEKLAFSAAFLGALIGIVLVIA